MGRINIEIGDEIHRKMKAACAMEGITISEFIDEILEKKIKNGRRKI